MSNISSQFLAKLVIQNSNFLFDTLFQLFLIFFVGVNLIIWKVCSNNHKIFHGQRSKKAKAISLMPKFTIYIKDFNNQISQKLKNLNRRQPIRLLNEIYNYGKDNLALIHVMIQSPYVTMIERDVSMTFTEYVANTGRDLFKLTFLANQFFKSKCCVKV